MSNVEDQLEEIEALRSIYEDDLTAETDTAHPLTVRLSIRSDNQLTVDESSLPKLKKNAKKNTNARWNKTAISGDDSVGKCLVNPCADVKFTLSPQYPDEPPEVDVDNVVGLPSTVVDDLVDHLRCKCRENVGTVMIFTVISETVDWLSQTVQTLEESRLLSERNAEELTDEDEKRKIEGTKVTVESFIKWNNAFITEMNAVRHALAASKCATETQKLTGKQLFLQDDSMVDSDIKFDSSSVPGGMDEDAAVVDESLFDDVESLQLSSSSSDVDSD